MDCPQYEQKSGEWHAWRKGKVGASDAPAIMGICPYKTTYQLWQEKLGLWHPTINPAMTRGTELEDEARKEFTRLTGIKNAPVLRNHPTIPWMAASLDGITESGLEIVEIKCNGEKNHNIAKEGKLPINHFAQVQHQLAVCGLENAYYFSYVPGDCIIIGVKRNDEYIEKLIKKETEFWNLVETLTPPPMTEKDYVTRDDHHWLSLAAEWKGLQTQKRELEEKEKYLRGIMQIVAQDVNVVGGGIKFTKRLRRGVIEYSEIPELIGMDLEKYRKESTTYWVITEDKNDNPDS